MLKRMDDFEESKMISIIIPVYNAEKYLKETVDSILSQSYKSIEMIIVNDGSTDGSQKIIEEYGRIDPRVKSVLTENMGAPHARNIGAQNATGKYLLFFDADDNMLPGALEKLVAGYDAPETELVIGGRLISNDKGIVYEKERLKAGLYNPGSADSEYLGSILPNPDNKLFLAKTYKENKILFADIKIAQDLNVYLKYLSICSSVNVISETVCTYRMVEGSISHTYNDKRIDIINCAKDVQSFAQKLVIDSNRKKMIIGACLRHYYNVILGTGIINNKKVRSKIINEICQSANRIMKERDIEEGSQAEHFYKKICFIQRFQYIYKSQMYYLYRLFRHRLGMILKIAIKQRILKDQG